MSYTQTQSEDFIRISSIGLNVPQKFSKTVDYYVTFEVLRKEILFQLTPGGEWKETFNPPLELSARDRLFVSKRIQSWQSPGWKQNTSITVELSDVMAKALNDREGGKACYRFDENIEVAIGVLCSNSVTSANLPEVPSSSTSISSDVLSICPRLRVLVIGNSGDGKSTLIQKAFGIEEVDVSENARGCADIDREFAAAGCPFLLHDSLGFEAGENTTIDKVKNFIGRRRKMRDLKDRLHAVWVCVAVPYANGRFLQAGTEEILRNRREIFGNIPIVVVLTKLDLLDKSLLVKRAVSGVVAESLEQAMSIISTARDDFLTKHCVHPLVDIVKCDIPHVAVSVESRLGLEPTIPELVKKTTSEIERYIHQI